MTTSDATGVRSKRIPGKDPIPTFVFDKDGNFIKEYPSLTEAASAAGISRGHACHHVRKGNMNRKSQWYFSYDRDFVPYDKTIYSKIF